MRVLVTGAHGQLGREIVKLFANVHEVFGFGHRELDITDPEQTDTIVGRVQPDVIIHSAAYTAVDRAQEERELAYLVNGLGTRNIAVAANAVGAKLCAISTDYVFDGQATNPYTENNKTNPQSVYGSSKLAGEQFIQDIMQRYFIVRTSWVFGLYGNNFVKTMLKIGNAGKSLRVVNDQIGSPTYTRDLAAFLLELVQSEKYGIYHASNRGSCSWYEFALEIFKQTSLAVDLTPCLTEEFPRPAPRPKYSVLDHGAIMKNGFTLLQPWKHALQDFLTELIHADMEALQ